MDIGPWELIIVLGLAVLLFGSAKIPQLARSIGSAKHEYERGLRGETGHEEASAVETASVEPMSEPVPTIADGLPVAIDPEHLVDHGTDEPLTD